MSRGEESVYIWGAKDDDDDDDVGEKAINFKTLLWITAAAAMRVDSESLKRSILRAHVLPSLD